MGIPDGIETGGVTPPTTHTHQGSFVPVLQKCPELAKIIMEILNFVGFFLIIVGIILSVSKGYVIQGFCTDFCRCNSKEHSRLRLFKNYRGGG